MALLFKFTSCFVSSSCINMTMIVTFFLLVDISSVHIIFVEMSKYSCEAESNQSFNV